MDPGECVAIFAGSRVEKRSEVQVGVMIGTRGLFGESRCMILSVDACADKGMFLCAGAWEVKDPSTKERRVQGAIQRYGVEAHKVPRLAHASDILTRPAGES